MSESDLHAHFKKLSVIDWVAIVFFWCLAMIVLIQFVSRYVFNDSIAWTEEISRYLLIAVVFIGSATGIRRKTHIRIEFLSNYLSQRASKRIELLKDLIVIAFLAVAVWFCFELAGRTAARMVSINIPKKVIYYVVSGGFVAMLGYALRNFQLDIRKKRRIEK